MTFLNQEQWEIIGATTAVIAVASFVVWLTLRKRPTPEELELARRALLVQSGRIVDGTLLDVYEVTAEDGRTLPMLLFNYRIAGVDYECSQDVTGLSEVVKLSEVRAGFPCSVRYQPGNPQNSIVVAEKWTGLRQGLPQLPTFQDPEPTDKSHLTGAG